MPLPCHGPISCRLCWVGSKGSEKGFGPSISTRAHRFRMVNDPGAWGAQVPQILVLGMSKGETQAAAMARAVIDGSFEAVPFAKMRPRLLQSLQAVGLLTGETSIDHRFLATEADYGWGSILRCSLTGWSKKNQRWSGASGDVIPGLRNPEGNEALKRCIRQHLKDLSDRTQLIVLLGNDDNYIAVVRHAFEEVFGVTISLPGTGSQAFRVGAQTVVHVGHPSPLNGHFISFLQGPVSTTQGAKREEAKLGVQIALFDNLDRERL